MIHPLLLAAGCPTTSDIFPSLYKGLYDSNCHVKFQHLTDIGIVLANIIQLLMTLGGVLAVVFVVWGSIQVITSQGDPARSKGARNTILNAVVGLVLTSGAYLLVQFFASKL
jgi:hypothetical protein